MPQRRTEWEKPTLFVFGVVFLVALLAIAALDRRPSNTSWHIYNSVLAIAAAGIAALLPGTLSLNWRPGLKATGALAMGALVFYSGKSIRNSDPIVQDLKSYLVFSDTASTEAANPNTSDVYVVVNEDVVASDLVSSQSMLRISNYTRKKDISMVRGVGGGRVDFKTLLQGDKIFIAEHDGEHWWKSADMIIPEAELQMSTVPLAAISQRVHGQK